MEKELYGTRLHINSKSLAHNINYLKTHVPKSQIIAMVKANAYGHGDILMSRKMEDLGINYFGVADFEEGLRLRNNGIVSPIMVMNPGDKNTHTIIENNLEPVIYNHFILASISRAINLKSQMQQKEIPVHIKINTGMNRWGFVFSEIPTLINEIKMMKSI